MVVGSSPTCGAKRDALGGVFFLLGTDLNLREGSETPWVSVPEILKPEGVKERSDRFVSFADLSIANERKSYHRSNGLYAYLIRLWSRSRLCDDFLIE